MTLPDPLYKLINLPALNISKRENQLLEMVLFISIYDELRVFFDHKYKNKHRMITTPIMENTMFEDNFIIMVIRDILASGEYSIEGIAHYTNTHPDVIQEIFLKCSSSISLNFLRKLIELHKSVRNDLYEDIIKKFVQKSIALGVNENAFSIP